MSQSRVLHVPFTYFPDPCGGTEVYVQGLVSQLEARGYACTVAAPGDATRSYRHGEVNVERFTIDSRKRVESAYGCPDLIAAAAFRGIVAKVRPAIVHLHARTAAVSEALVDVAREFDARVVFTYHTPTVSCARGTMLMFGNKVCDGVLDYRRCTACALCAYGIPRSVSFLAASLPVALARRLAALDLKSPFSALRVPGLIADGQSRFRSLMAKVDYVVAVCDWVADVLWRNGVGAEKMMLSRQGVSQDPQERPVATKRPPRSEGAVRLAYFGRVDQTKGIDLLVDAFARVPDIDIRLDLYLVAQHDLQAFDVIQPEILKDKRITICPPVSSKSIVEVMAAYDLIAVPSRWLETGPLVALEAFSAGVPVLGADQGGIAELVQDGVDGLLFAPNDSRAIAELLGQVAFDRSIIERLRANIKPPRTMSTVADEMAALYARLLLPS